VAFGKTDGQHDVTMAEDDYWPRFSASSPRGARQEELPLIHDGEAGASIVGLYEESATPAPGRPVEASHPTAARTTSRPMTGTLAAVDPYAAPKSAPTPSKAGRWWLVGCLVACAFVGLILVAFLGSWWLLQPGGLLHPLPRGGIQYDPIDAGS
jgi:hypothetical protein